MIGKELENCICERQEREKVMKQARCQCARSTDDSAGRNCTLRGEQEVIEQSLSSFHCMSGAIFFKRPDPEVDKMNTSK